MMDRRPCPPTTSRPSSPPPPPPQPPPLLRSPRPPPPPSPRPPPMAPVAGADRRRCCRRSLCAVRRRGQRPSRPGSRPPARRAAPPTGGVSSRAHGVRPRGLGAPRAGDDILEAHHRRQQVLGAELPRLGRVAVAGLEVGHRRRDQDRAEVVAYCLRDGGARIVQPHRLRTRPHGQAERPAPAESEQESHPVGDGGGAEPVDVRHGDNGLLALRLPLGDLLGDLLCGGHGQLRADEWVSLQCS